MEDGPFARGGDGGRGDGLGHEPPDLFLAHEARFEVELGELELAVGAQVFVSQAARELVIAVHPADHRQLLEQLRALRQRVERARLEAGRDDEVAGAFGGRGDQHGRLDLGETLVDHRAADGHVDLGAQAEVALQPFPAQVEIAVAQPLVLIDVDVFRQRDRRWFRD